VATITKVECNSFVVLLEAGIYYWAMNRKVEVLPDQAALARSLDLILAK